MLAWSSNLRALARASSASSPARLASASRLASVASSCASSLRSSGLSISASGWSLVTLSPATTFSVTVPPAIAYSTGLLAAMTRPSAEMSRTRSPRVTCAMRTREASTDRLPALHPVATQPIISNRPTPAAPPISHDFFSAGKRRAFEDAAGGERGRSCPEVSRMLMGQSGSQSALSPIKHESCQSQGLDLQGCVRTCPGVHADTTASGGRCTAEIRGFGIPRSLPLNCLPLAGVPPYMCGIVGAIADRDVVPVLIEGLKRLEYRAYDSAGIAVVDANSN